MSSGSQRIIVEIDPAVNGRCAEEEPLSTNKGNLGLVFPPRRSTEKEG